VTERIDGLSVIALFVFAVAVMDGVVAQTVARPTLVLGLLGLAFATSLVLGAITALVFWRAGRAPRADKAAFGIDCVAASTQEPV